jgi:hypothetical protein
MQVNNRYKQIGVNQRIRLEWLETTANLVLAGNDRTAVMNELRSLLNDKLSVGNTPVRGNREKAVTILTKIWVNPAPEVGELQNAGLDLLKVVPASMHRVLHWGMTMAAYPFWAAVAEQAGRLLSLQGTVAPAHVQRRLREQYGERETVARAARRVLRAFVDWEVLAESPKKGVYIEGTRQAIEQPEITAWLIEALLHAQPIENASLSVLLDSPILFPFTLQHISASQLVASSSHLDTLRHGLDEDLIMLHKSSCIAASM